MIAHSLASTAMVMTAGQESPVVGDYSSPRSQSVDFLVCDSSASSLRAVGAAVVRCGLSVITCRTFDEAENMMKFCVPKVLLIDVGWRFTEAAEILGRVRSNCPEVRCIFMTAHSNIASAVRLVKLGADNYLSKSIGHDRLIAAAISGENAKIPEKPINPERLFWEYVHATLMRNSHNVSETARALKMHRRTLQRILNKSAPP